MTIDLHNPSPDVIEAVARALMESSLPPTVPNRLAYYMFDAKEAIAALAGMMPPTPDDGRETIEGLVRQFAHEIVRDGVPCLTTGGFSVIEEAFDTLGWSDPHPCPEQACDHPGCPEWATCGTPTPQGYKRLCESHYQAIAAASQDGSS